MARVSARKFKPRDKTLETLLGELIGGTPPEDHSNVPTLVNVRRLVYGAAQNFVKETLLLAGEFPEFAPEATRMREAFQQMFANKSFLSEEALAGDEATEFKRNYLETKKHPLAQMILEATCVLTKLRILPPSTLNPEELAHQNFQLTRAPVALLGRENVFGSDAGAPRFLALCEKLPKLAKAGVDFYDATLEPEIDIERMLSIVSTIIPMLAKNTRDCKNAIGAISRAKNILKNNIRKYMRLVTVRNSPLALFEGLIEDIKEDALQSAEGDRKDNMATARELTSILREIRTSFNLHSSSVNPQAAKISKLIDMADGYLEQLSQIDDHADDEEREAQARESTSSFESLIRALSDV